MHQPPPLHLTFRRSRIAVAAIAAAHALTGALLFWLPWPLGFRVAILAGLAFAVAIALRNAVGSRSALTLQLGIDRRIAVVTRGGREYRGEVLAGSYVGAHVTTIVWRATGTWMTKSILALPDSLPPDDFRRLRIMLRYGRSSDPTDGRSDVTAVS